MNPKVSIIIATFNSEKTLKRTMDSVLNQNFQEWECIVVDGASKDGTIDIIKEFMAKDSRFRYISEPDHGIYDAFNKGWKMAKGEWIMYLGSDDEYTKDGIKALMENCEGADVVYGDVILKFENGTTKKQKGKKTNFWGTSGFCCHQAVAMQKNVIEKLGGFDEKYRILADWNAIRLAGQLGYIFKYVSIPIAYFFVGGASSSNYKVLLEGYSIYRKTNNLVRSVFKLLAEICSKKVIQLKHNFAL